MQPTPLSSRIDEILVGDKRPGEDVLDDVYLRFRDSHPFMPVVHFVDHSTMGPEALVALGLGHKVLGWTSHHSVRSYEPSRRGIALPSDWREAVGREDCHGDWLDFFDSELNARPFRDVLGLWCERFASDVGTLLFHGLIRTAHAVRALQHGDTPERRGELARGLALWAIGRRHAPDGRAEVRTTAAGTEEIMRCARAGAATFVCRSTIPNLHLVTGPMAYLMIAPLLEERVHEVATSSFQLTHAAALRTFDSNLRRAQLEHDASLDHHHLEALADQTDAHPAKLTEAALRAFKTTGDSLFLKAAGRVQDYNLWRALVG